MQKFINFRKHSCFCFKKFLIQNFCINFEYFLRHLLNDNIFRHQIKVEVYANWLLLSDCVKILELVLKEKIKKDNYSMR
jgi:hypothetical protein